MLTPLQRLKIDLLVEGIEVSAEAHRALAGEDGARPLTLADYASTSGITLRLGADVWVNAPLASHNPNFVRAPRHRLVQVGDAFAVVGPGVEVPATPIPVPGWHAGTNRWGEPYTRFGITHSDRVRISPLEGCAIACRFCDLPFEFRYRTKPVEPLIDVIDCALADEVLPAHHVLVSGGLPKAPDYAWLQGVWRDVVRAFPHVPVDVMIVPVPDLLDPAELAAAGVHGVSLNLELWGEERARGVMPGKARFGRAVWLDAIERAVAAFEPGRVRSLLLVGIEPLDDTLAAVEALAERGCDPVLSPFRPDPATPMRDEAPPSAALLAEAWERASEIVERHGVALGPRCIPCMHNTLTFPDGSGRYTTTPRPAAFA